MGGSDDHLGFRLPFPYNLIYCVTYIASLGSCTQLVYYNLVPLSANPALSNNEYPGPSNNEYLKFLDFFLQPPGTVAVAATRALFISFLAFNYHLRSFYSYFFHNFRQARYFAIIPLTLLAFLTFGDLRVDFTTLSRSLGLVFTAWRIMNRETGVLLIATYVLNIPPEVILRTHSVAGSMYIFLLCAIIPCVSFLGAPPPGATTLWGFAKSIALEFLHFIGIWLFPTAYERIKQWEIDWWPLVPDETKRFLDCPCRHRCERSCEFCNDSSNLQAFMGCNHSKDVIAYLYAIEAMTAKSRQPFGVYRSSNRTRAALLIVSEYSELTFDILAGSSGLALLFELDGNRYEPKQLIVREAYLKAATEFKLVNKGRLATSKSLKDVIAVGM